MQLNLQMEGAENGGLQQTCSSDDGQILLALRQVIEEIKEMATSHIHEEKVPIIENLFSKAEEEFQSVEKKLSDWRDSVLRNCANEINMLKETHLQLKFSDEVSDPVFTGNEIKGKEGNPMEVALFDEATGEIVKFGPGSSTEVEILVLDPSGDNDCNWTHESFNSRIVREGDNNMPRLAKPIYITLNEGVGALKDVELRRPKSAWLKKCKCRLGARMKENPRGITVQEAWTKSFEVLDSRSTLYKKQYPPSLSDEVWRLESIGKDGVPCKRLEKENIKTVEDFLFLLSVDPQGLQKIVGAGPTKWKATVNHARTCTIDDKKMYLHYPSAECQEGVMLDALGGLKGIVNESHYVPIDDLPADEKGCAHNSLLLSFKNREEFSAFKNREGTISFDDEASLLQKFPYSSSDINASKNSIQEDSNGIDFTISENINDYYPTGPDPGTSSQSINPCSRPSDGPNNVFHLGPPTPSYLSPDIDCLLRFFGSLESTAMGPICDPIFGYSFTNPGTSSQSINPCSRTSDGPNNVFHLGAPTPSCLSPDIDIDCFLGPSGDNSSLMSSDESHSHHQSNAQAYRLVGLVVLWVVRVKKRVVPLEGIHVQKKQRI